MSDLRQMPLFEPQAPQELNIHTPLKLTLPLFQRFLMQEGKSEYTIKAFTGDLKLVGEFLGDDKPIGQFTTDDLNRFLDWLENGRGVPCSRKSYARRVTTLKVYFKWLNGLGTLPHDPARPVLQRSGPAPLSEVLSADQIRDCLDYARTLRKGDIQDYRPEMLFRLLADTGIKKGEAVRLVTGDIDRTNPRQPLLMVRQKTRNVYKERRIVLDSEWLKLFDLYRQQYPPKKDEIFTCTARNLEYILTDVGEGAGVSFKLSFEVMRWTCAVTDYRAGMDEDRIREKLGLSEASWQETGSKIKQLSERLARSQ